ncbi:MAG: hypothetical protein J5852_01120 [Clostridia bacterium]|nr:hypothetical protein [Clostridia bacterium]
MASKMIRYSKQALRKALSPFIAVILIMTILTASVLAWFVMKNGLLSYIPVANPELLFIGAGHRDFDSANHEFTDDHFEDIRYLYFNGIDVEADDADYYDYVFCVYGSMVSGYRLQLAYTTNNQFSYEIFHANESTVTSEGAVAYTTHTDTPQTFYYSANGAAISGSFLNDTTISGEKLANSTKHTETYGSYNNVNKYAEPLYWQTTNMEHGYISGDFINYYILRVNVGDKAVNDRETDVICIAAKSFSS